MEQNCFKEVSCKPSLPWLTLIIYGTWCCVTSFAPCPTIILASLVVRADRGERECRTKYINEVTCEVMSWWISESLSKYVGAIQQVNTLLNKLTSKGMNEKGNVCTSNWKSQKTKLYQINAQIKYFHKLQLSQSRIHNILMPALNIDTPARKLRSSIARRASEILNPIVSLKEQN